MMRLAISFFLTFACLTHALGDGLPVTLVLKRSEQQDSTGCNLVKEVTRLLYQEIQENRVRIWDSPQKELSFSPATLKSLEKSAGILFTGQESMFIYEKWTQTKREVTTVTAGFYFLYKDERGDETVFGFVDYNDVQALFAKTKIGTNASGNYSSTFESVLKSKNFNYQILQLGDRICTTANEAMEMKIAFVGNRVFNESTLGYYPPDKCITYIIDNFSDDEDAKALNGKRLSKLLEEYLFRNMEIYYNMGGDRITSHMSKNKIKVTRVQVEEIWRKVGTEIIYEPRSVTVFVNDSALNPVNARDHGEFEFRFGEYDIFGFIRTKEFNIIISRINDEAIERPDAYLYYKALMNTEWNMLNRYVADYK